MKCRSLVVAAKWFLCAATFLLSAQATALSTPEVDSSRAEEGEEAGGQETAMTRSALEASRWRRVHLEYVPSFSPYFRIEYAWSQRGSWLVASSVAHWPPPIPAVNSSSLMERKDASAWRAAVREVLRLAAPVACERTKNVARGDAQLRIEEGEVGVEHCFLLHEDRATGHLAPSVNALMQYSPRIQEVDRWTHPFWLVDESGTLRLELKGTAELAIDGDLYGRVNGVLTLRLPVGNRTLALTPVDSDDVRQVEVFLRKEQTTILRLSVESEAMTIVPSWSQPRR